MLLGELIHLVESTKGSSITDRKLLNMRIKFATNDGYSYATKEITATVQDNVIVIEEEV